MRTITVTIPSREQHEGFSKVTLEIPAVCPKCGGKRAVKRWKGRSYDGSRYMEVDCWTNECGCIDKYRDVVVEAREFKQKEQKEQKEQKKQDENY